MVILGLVLITFIYLLFPILYKAHKGKTKFSKALLLSVTNSAICTVIYFFVAKYGAETLDNNVDYAKRYLPVFIFFSIIFTLIGFAILKKKKIKNENNETTQSNANLQSDTINEEQKKTPNSVNKDC